LVIAWPRVPADVAFHTASPQPTLAACRARWQSWQAADSQPTA